MGDQLFGYHPLNRLYLKLCLKDFGLGNRNVIPLSDRLWGRLQHTIYISGTYDLIQCLQKKK